MIEGLLNFIERKKLLITLVTVVVTVILGKQATKLEIKTDLLELLPSNFESVKSLNRIAELTGGLGYFVVMAEGENREKNIEFITEFSERAKTEEGILYIDYKQPAKFIEKNGVLWLPLDDIRTMHDDLENRISYFRKKAISILPDEMGPPPIFRTKELMVELEAKVSRSPFHESNEGRMVLSIVKPTEDSTNIKFTKDLYQRLSVISDEVGLKYPEVEKYYTGLYSIKVAQIESIEHDLLKATLFTIFGVSICLLIFFRSYKAILIAGAPLIVAIIWTLGVHYMLVGHVNLISSFFVSVLFGIGIDYSLQIFARFKEEFLKVRDHKKALAIAFATTGKGTLFGAMTTFSVFFIIIFSDFLPFRETGILSAVGIILILASVLIYLPLMIFILKPSFRFFQVKNGDNLESKRTEHSVRYMQFIHDNRRSIVMVWLVVAVVGIFAIPYNRFEYDFQEMENKNLVSNMKMIELSESLDRYIRPSVFVLRNLDEVNELRKVVTELEQRENSQIAKHLSIIDFYPYPKSDLEYRVNKINQIREMLLKNIKNMNENDRTLLNKYLKYLYPEPTEIENYPRAIKNAFTGADEKGPIFYYLIYPDNEMDMGLEAIEFSKELLEASEMVDFEMEMTSDTILLGEILELISHEGVVLMPFVLASIVIMITILFRRVAKVGMVLIPLGVGLFILSEFLGFSHYLGHGISLNYLNIVVIPILLGVGVDYAIHIYHRLEESYKDGEKLRKAKWHDVAQTAYALLISAITTMIGFSSLFLANYVGLRSIAWISVMGILLILLASAVLLPAIFFMIQAQKVHKTRKDRKIANGAKKAK